MIILIILTRIIKMIDDNLMIFTRMIRMIGDNFDHLDQDNKND